MRSGQVGKTTETECWETLDGSTEHLKKATYKLGQLQPNLLTAVTRKTNFVLPTKLEEELSVFVCGIRIRMQNFEEVAAPQKAA